MEIYGDSGYIMADNKNDMRVKNYTMTHENKLQIRNQDAEVYEDPFEYFADVINGRIEVEPFGTYSLENNIKVVEILDAARLSAEKGKTIYLK